MEELQAMAAIDGRRALVTSPGPVSSPY